MLSISLALPKIFTVFWATEPPVIAPDGSEVYPFGPGDYLSRWRVAKDSYDKLVKDDMIVWKKNDGGDFPTVEGYKK